MPIFAPSSYQDHNQVINRLMKGQKALSVIRAAEKTLVILLLGQMERKGIRCLASNQWEYVTGSQAGFEEGWKPLTRARWLYQVPH